jgi:hypothetical protein
VGPSTHRPCRIRKYVSAARSYTVALKVGLCVQGWRGHGGLHWFLWLMLVRVMHSSRMLPDCAVSSSLHVLSGEPHRVGDGFRGGSICMQFLAVWLFSA